MPVPDGYEATRESRRREAARLPAARRVSKSIAMTANAMHDDGKMSPCCRHGHLPQQTRPPRRVASCLGWFDSRRFAADAPDCGKRPRQPARAEGTGSRPRSAPILLHRHEAPRLAKLHELAVGENRANFARAAHSLGDSASIFGLGEFREQAILLETQVQAGARAEYGSAIAARGNQFIAVKPQLEAQLVELIKASPPASKAP